MDICLVCGCTRILVKGVYQYYRADGVRFTYENPDDGEKILLEIEREIEKLKKRK